ncbi:uncharacterized protein LOC127010807 [Drosophila biarmipes]|uniref:uncharacterized protein LOC127010807 n=1 Tax=Drosophila biarmipes TaxID=125945 RepID=UPI0021CC54B1|nr:uncharacterized protein LOC127010807 [Drosophila biarmipes]
MGIFAKFMIYNVTVDACKFLKSPKSNPVAFFFYELFRDFSNMNHTCPFNHDLLLEKMSYASVFNRFTSKLSFPEGSYMFELHWMAYDIDRALPRFYWSLS